MVKDIGGNNPIQESPEKLGRKLEEITRKESIEKFLRKYKSPDISKEEIETTDRVIQNLSQRLESMLKESGQEFNQNHLLTYLLETLDEAHGNFNAIFPEQKILWKEFVEKIETTPDAMTIKSIEPLEYYQLMLRKNQ